MVTVSRQLSVTRVHFGYLDQGYLYSINKCLNSFIDNLSRNCGAFRCLAAVQMDALFWKWAYFFPSTCTLLILFLKVWLSNELISWLEDLPPESLLPLVEASKGHVENWRGKKKKKRHAQLSLLQQWLYFEYFVQQGILYSVLWEDRLGLWLLQLYNRLGCDWPDWTEDCEVRAHLFLLINILLCTLWSTFIAHQEAMQCGSLVWGLSCLILKHVWIIFFPSISPSFQISTYWLMEYKVKILWRSKTQIISNERTLITE